MADRNHPNTADQVDLPDDDPFAELTRIMGFDPRQQARPATGQQQAAAASDEEDFNIDLEKELMGEFEAEEPRYEEPASESETRSEESASAEDFELDLAADFDDALASAVRDERDETPEASLEDGYVETQSESPEVAADRQPGDDVEIDFSADFEEALSAASEERDDIPAVAVDDVQVETGFADEIEETPAEAAAEERFEAPDLAIEDDIELELDGHLDEALAAAVEADHAGFAAPAVEHAHDGIQPVDDRANSPEIGELDVAPVEADADEPVQAEERFEAPEIEEDELELDLADDFDDALAASVAAEADSEDRPETDSEESDEVATAFAGPQEAVAPESEEDFAVPEAATPEEAAYVELAVEQEPEDLFSDGDLQFGDADAPEELTATAEDPQDLADAPDAPEATAEEPEVTDLPAFPMHRADWQPEEAPAEPQGNEAYSPVDAESDAAFDAHDAGLEDELNALLGNRPSHAPAMEPPAESWADTPDAAQPDAHAAEFEAELDWDLGEEDFSLDGAEDDQIAAEPQEHSHGEPEGRYEPVSFDSRDDDQLFDHEADEFADHDLPDFDHDALDEAIARGMDADATHHDDHPRVAHVADRSGPREDPLDAIAALTAKYASPLPNSYERTASLAQPVSERSVDYLAAEPFESAPEIETIEVHDKAVALADDLEIPEFAYDDELPPVSSYDDLDADFGGLLEEMNGAEPAPRKAAASYDDDGAEVPAGENGRGNDDFADEALSVATHPAYDDDMHAAYGYQAANAAGETSDFEAGDYGYDHESAGADAPRPAGERTSLGSRGMLIAAIVGGVAIVGGLGAFALSFGGDDGPAVVRADDGPIKVKPENPGGTTVPNQDNMVYERVAGTGPVDMPQQETLVTTAEEPVDVTPPAPEPELVDLAPAQGEETLPGQASPDEAAPEMVAEAPAAPVGTAAPAEAAEAPAASAKSEDRIQQILEEAEAGSDAQVAAIAPRRVRTLVVRPDGTLVPREDPVPAEVADPQAAGARILAEPAAAAPVVPAAAATTSGFTTPGGDAGAAQAAAATPDSTASAADVPLSQQPVFPDSVPIAPQRPAEQPVEVVGEVKAGQVAALNPTTATTGSWSMQIASQPSEAAAQSSYQDLLRRYGSVLDGRQANIVKAEIAGKGTFWRVRVPAQTRNEAITLCESYKAAGGNCFVSR